MVSGWQNAIVAEARERIQTINQNIMQFKQHIVEARDAEQYRYDSEGFYVAARDKLISISEDVDQLYLFVETNKDILSQFDSKVYYESELLSLRGRVRALESIIVQPGSTTYQSETGVDPSFDGIVTSVEDGDTIKVDDKVIRMAGIDAKEGGTDHGKLAAKYLSDLILGKKVHVAVDRNTRFDQYGRGLGVIQLDGRDINVEMLSACMADANLKFGKHHNVDPDVNRNAVSKCVFGWPLEAQVKIVSDPLKATVWIDGKDINDPTPSDTRISLGLHQIVVFKAGFSALHDIIDIKEPKKIELPPFKLEKIASGLGLVSIKVTDPTGILAAVSVDGVLQGAAPVVLELPLDKPSVVIVSSEGYQEEMFNTQGIVGTVVRIDVQLKKV